MKQSHQVLLLDLISESPKTINDLVAQTDLKDVRLRHHVKDLRDRGLIHRCRWEPDAVGLYRTPVYTIGPGTDAPRPKLEEGRGSFKRSKKRVAPDWDLSRVPRSVFDIERM